MITLIGSNTSPYVRKVRVVLAEKGVGYDHQPEDVWSPATRIGAFNPIGKVPCLVLEDGTSIYDSPVIVDYLDAAYPLPPLIPKPLRERTAVRTWEALADGVLDAGLTARMEQAWPHRPSEQRSQAWIDRYVDKIRSGLAAMDRQLGDRRYCHGDALTLADIVTAAATGYVDFRFPEIAWRPAHPALARLVALLGERESFRSTAPA